ncbi:MAG: hypothetical protein N2509_03165, partial [Treponemataceae bacterium]|nr:hypothetical protein [Treponemataceae bacterium]
MFLSLRSKRYPSVIEGISKKEKSSSKVQGKECPFSIIFHSSSEVDKNKKETSPIAVASLFLANLILSYQVELISGILSNLLFFGISHGCALILAVALSHYQKSGKRWRVILVPAVILAFPFAVRALVLFSGLWVPPRTVAYDALLLYVD